MRRIVGEARSAANSNAKTVDAIFGDIDHERALLVRVFAVLPPFLAVVLSDEEFDGADARRSDIVNSIVDLKPM